MADDQRVVWDGFLRQWGLSGLQTADGKDFLNEMVTGSWSTDRINAELFKTPKFQQTFPEYQARIDAGKAPMTPVDILNYRSSVSKVMKDAGLPAGYYDQPDDFVNLVKSDLSPSEIQQRVQTGFAKVANSPPQVRAAFNSFFGVNGDAALATFFLDPAKGQDFLTQATQQAEIAGTGAQFGFNVSQDFAEKLRLGGASDQTAQAGFRQAQQLKPLMEGTASESTDLGQENVIGAAFGGSDAEVRRRQQERQAQFQGGGGAAGSSKGLGLGGTQPA